MAQRTSIHVLDRDARSRAQLAHLISTLGYHAEIYEHPDELLDHRPQEGILFACDGGEAETMAQTAPAVIERLSDQGVWLPALVASRDPEVDAAVAAMQAGAIDYLALPMPDRAMEEALRRAERIAARQGRHQRRMIRARTKIAKLSERESEVLTLVSQGCSNKESARHLGISPRTVEIHRANMMLKLGASSGAEALRILFEARVDDWDAPGAWQERASQDLPSGACDRPATAHVMSSEDEPHVRSLPKQPAISRN